MRIYVGGSLENGVDDPDECKQFVVKLGVEIVKQGHILLNGCRSSFDVAIAQAAHEWLTTNKQPTSEVGSPAGQIISYHLKSEKPKHNYGRIKKSQLVTWDMYQKELSVPEQINEADATIFVAGSDGTFWAKNWASYTRKPIFGIPRFGGSGETIYYQEMNDLRRSNPVQTGEYEKLNESSTDMEHYANEVITVIERLVKPRNVFLIMSFDKKYSEVYKTCQAVCKQLDFDAEGTKDSLSSERITHLIEFGIRQSAFVIADVSEESPNVYYEVGFARALGKDVLLTAQQGTKLPFDVFDLETIFWKKPEDLMRELKPWVDKMAKKHGK